ncbi:chromosome segregation protein SMC [Ferrimonas balearica]|uniref:chromosome segregation protein SMC n=1 Tax=Ferrimonas balearica TaxID=44012 RepID=UPI001C98F8FD|nr:chromosome segregation protein SMC [Ferrimonas balearica]MBY5922309.1 chromosome segregation protein SMC [Ferrimonas balearica]MBY5994351.1 chromosome segregation protein SMC [Ferrimonas balearica]
MRLKQIKLAGFKSFVDPTKVPFPDQMTAIVGPNGCGKSNVIDAVRWVLGESSAKNLRGDAMTDVIFNGSSGRKPVSVASVELVFDNSAGRLDGQYASYAEIAVKRQVTRDGQSNYFLNGSKCRRRDITDLFMGTGLGPRSYAIIEQGMISRLIESKPQELRVFIEEAAGISRYKERRRETENRIRHTRENLERLTDVRTELGSQIERLRRQADAARRYRELKAQERTLHGELLALRWREISGRMDQLDQTIQALETKKTQFESATAGDSATVTTLEQQRSDLSAEVERCQQSLFTLGSQITRLEQQILHSRQRRQQLEDEIRRNQMQAGSAEENLRQLDEEQGELEESIAMMAPEQEALAEALEELTLALEEAQMAFEALGDERDTARDAQAQSQRAAQVVITELAGLERERQQIASSRQRLAEQLAQWNPEALEAELAQTDEALQSAEAELESETARLEQAQQAREAAEAEREASQAQVAHLDGELVRLEARQASLSTLLKARETRLPAPFDDLPRAWQQWSVEEGWAAAVEQVLSRPMQAVVGAESQTLPEGTQRLLTQDAAAPIEAAHPWPRLLDKIRSPFNLSPWLAQVYCADTPEQAEAWLSQAGPDVSVVLPDGRWLAKGFEAAPGKSSERPLTEIQAELEALQLEQPRVEAQRAEAEERLQRATGQLDAARQQEEQLRRAVQTAREALLTLQGRRESLAQRLEQQRQQRALLEEQQEELALRAEELEDRQLELEARQAQLGEEQEQAQARLDQVELRTESARESLRARRAQRDQQQQRLQQLQLSLQGQEARLQGLSARRLQAQESQGEWRERCELAREEQEALLEPLAEYEASLALELEQRVLLEEELAGRREALEEVNQTLASLADSQRGQQAQLQAVVADLSRHQLEYEGLRVQAQGQLDLLAESEMQLKGILESLSPEAAVNQWQADLERVRERIKRLGAINMAAIEEYEQQSERKAYLDAQDDDLNQALEVLETAIRKIDRETRQMFRDTFDKVNTDLGTLFPKVFGGGSAYLALTDDDLLNTGVTIMARPPGKKNSTIHLLSGGEKALTALSLVFAIFRLNPAPFCMLDEVDAPLDDANVGRFCRLVKEMSETVQFIFISHNKVSMEMADRLTGVTMHEPGVSRIVAVDIEEAAAMAQMG